MRKLLTLLILIMGCSFGSYAITPIIGPHSCCVGSTIYLSDTTTGGTWTSSNPAIATIGSSSGIVTGVSAGVCDITYTLSTGFATISLTVATAPAPIVGGGVSICVGSTTTMSDATPGGVWSSGYTWVATVGSATGVVTGVGAGTTNIYYTLGGCSISAPVTVNATSTGSISGPSTVCAGSTITLTDSFGLSGTWSSSSTSIATVGTSGIVTGVAAGTVTITFTTSGPCGSAYTTHTVTVLNTTSAGAITGPSTVALGNSITLSNPTSSIGTHTWSSSAPSVATIGTTSGVVNGLSLGTTNIMYSITGCGGTATTTTNVTVVSLDGISGHVNFSGGGYVGLVKVYLIRYNPSTLILSAYDSVNNYCTGSSVYYQFTGLPTDSFRVKAAVNDTFGGSTTGFIPTYHTTHFYWHDADVIAHVSGSSDINEDINMSYGTTTSGPGFIGGSVLTGANKGTSGAVPVKGMRMCIINSTSSQLLGAAYTDATGHYSFSNLPVGQTYYVFPDTINYMTTPYTAITLTTGSPSMSTASFIQHTISMTVTPVTVGVKPVVSTVESVSAYPNPANDKLNIAWTANADEHATVVLTDVTGRIIYNSGMNITKGAGVKQIDLSNAPNGLYIVSVKSPSFSYTTKVEVLH